MKDPVQSQEHASLPIQPHLVEIRQRIHEHGGLVLIAEPGAGKTTQVPHALIFGGEAYAPPSLAAQHARGVLVEPRRVAARLTATFLCERLNQQLGECVGLETRDERHVSAQTRLRVMTPGILRYAMTTAAFWEQIDYIILDEVHERYWEGDLVMALWLVRRNEGAPVPALVLMSATLDSAALPTHLGVPSYHVEGRSYPIATRYVPPLGRERSDAHIARALRGELARKPQGVLVFVPTIRGTEQARYACTFAEEAGYRLEVLHGSLSAQHQRQVVEPRSPGRRVVFATNLAESALTLHGIDTVIDTGLYRAAAEAPSGVTQLKTMPAPRFNLTQRAGRAGRLGPGTAIKLYSQADEAGRPRSAAPALLRSDRLEATLAAAALGWVGEALPWPDPPPPSAWQEARRTLERLGALAVSPAPPQASITHAAEFTGRAPGESELEISSKLTAWGAWLRTLPVHPRLARFGADLAALGYGPLAAQLVLALDEGVLVPPAGESLLLLDEALSPWGELELELRLPEARRRRIERSLECSMRVAGARAQALPGPGNASDELHGDDDCHTAVARAALAAFPERVAALAHGRYRLAGGGEFKLEAPPSSHLIVLDGIYIGKHQLKPTVALSVDPIWLLEHETCLEETTHYLFEPQKAGVYLRRSLRFLELELERSERLAEPNAEVAAVLAATLSARNLQDLGPAKHIDAELNRLETAYAAGILAELTNESAAQRAIQGADASPSQPAHERTPSKTSVEASPTASTSTRGASAWRDALALAAARGCVTLADVRALGLRGALLTLVGAATQARLDAELPFRLDLGGHRRFNVSYRPTGKVVIAAPLQAFFGLKAPLTLAGGRIKPVFELLAPNQRPVQVTQDLASFFTTTYPTLYKALSRRYPRHTWPAPGPTTTP